MRACDLAIRQPADPDQPPPLNTLSHLASGEHKYLPPLKQEGEWASGYSADSMVIWNFGCVIMLPAEYRMEAGFDQANSIFDTMT